MCWSEILSKVAKKDETNLLLPNPFFIFASDDLNKKINLKEYLPGAFKETPS